MAVPVQYLDRLELTLAPWIWPFVARYRVEIGDFFQKEQQKNPTLWNGSLLLMREAKIAGRTLSASFFETDFASMVAGFAWDAMGEVKSCFPAAALLCSDGAFVLGEMAPHTRNAGQIFFPCGSIEPLDVTGDRVDATATLRRELLEETGISAGEFDEDPGWHTLTVGPLMPLIKILRAGVSAPALRDRIRANLLAQQVPELRDMRIVRDLGDISAATPAWVTEFLRHFWAA
jgi:8-oxo-dGTP pyrophosphatase MutT (NUDIX family)